MVLMFLASSKILAAASEINWSREFWRSKSLISRFLNISVRTERSGLKISKLKAAKNCWVRSNGLLIQMVLWSLAKKLCLANNTSISAGFWKGVERNVVDFICQFWGQLFRSLIKFKAWI